MSSSKHFSFIIFHAIMLAMLCCLDAKPALHTKDKGVTLPIPASAFNNSWCRSAYFKERITQPGCEPKLVYNRFCYGQCTSFYVPRYPLASFRSCTACVPVVKEMKVIRLKCPQRKVQVQLKKIMLVKSCRCRSDTWSNTKGLKPT